MSAGLLFLVSVVAGLIGSVSGMGGGVVLIPALTLCGIDIRAAIAISNISVVVVSNTAAPSYVRKRLPNLKAGAFLELAAVLGAIAGASAAVVTERRVLFVLCGGILLIGSMFLWKQRREDREPVSRQDAVSRWLGFEGSYYDDAERKTLFYRGGRALLGGPLMFGAGVTSGLLGMGGSALSVLIHHLVLGFPAKVSLAMTNLLIGAMALAGAGVYLEAGLIDSRLAAVVILGVPFGAFLGSSFLVRLTNRLARTVFFGILLVLSAEMVLQGVFSGR